MRRTMVLVMILLNLLLAAAVLVAGLTAEAEPEPAAETVDVRWATVRTNAPVFDGPGWEGKLIGGAPTGSAVEVIAEKNGWALCWRCTDKVETVWMLTDHVDFVE